MKPDMVRYLSTLFFFFFGTLSIYRICRLLCLVKTTVVCFCTVRARPERPGPVLATSVACMVHYGVLW